MKLKSFHVTNFQSVLDSGAIEVEEVTCLVGKNEAGKSALLKALYKLNPIRPSEANYSVVDDYPRMRVTAYKGAVARKEKDHDRVVVVYYELDDFELDVIVEKFGPKFLTDRKFMITKTYANKRAYAINCDDGEAIKYLIGGLGREPKKAAAGAKTAQDLLKALQPLSSDTAVAAILPLVTKMAELGFSIFAINEILKYEPKFLYFDDYYLMTGRENIPALQQRLTDNQLKTSDEPLLGLISLAELDLGQMANATSTQDLKNTLQGASNHLTQQILPYWSQNKHIRMTFDVREGRQNDPAGMQSGPNIWGEVEDTRHSVSTSLGSRSKGFIWFFSFVAWYSKIKNAGANVILLLDEPGLTLHGKAQGDLLRYFDAEVAEDHQLIYTSHSPFMVDSKRLDRVRIVQDLSIDKDNLPADQQGTKVLTDIHKATDDSLFPLQGALGYEIQQTLFIGPNALLIEGPSDMMYISAMSSLLECDGRVGLSGEWVMTPTGGASKVPTFVRLLTNQKGMRLATLVDFHETDRATIEGLYKDKLLKKAQVRTFADYTGTKEADIEDMFEPDFYLELVNEEYKKALAKPLVLSDLQSQAPRILKRIEIHLEAAPLVSGKFSHYRPARYFQDNLKNLESKISADTKDRFEKAFVELNKLLGA